MVEITEKRLSAKLPDGLLIEQALHLANTGTSIKMGLLSVRFQAFLTCFYGQMFQKYGFVRKSSLIKINVFALCSIIYVQRNDKADQRQSQSEAKTIADAVLKPQHFA